MISWPKCGQENCTDDASARVFWPGRAPMYACAIHTIKAQQVGQVIGCYIHAEPLKPEDVLHTEPHPEPSGVGPRKPSQP